MADDTLLAELTQTNHDTAGIQLLVSSIQWNSSIAGISATEINEAHLDETAYRVGITGNIDNLSADAVGLSISDHAWLEVADTSEGVSFQFHGDGTVVQLAPSEVISGTQTINLELPRSTALADVDTPGLTVELVDSGYLDEPYYRANLNGFVVGASSNDIRLATGDGKKFCLKAHPQGNAAIARIGTSGEHDFEAVRGLDSGLIFPE